MLTYETLVTALLGGSERVGLNIFFSQEQLDPHSLTRTFTMTCFPYGHTQPEVLSPYATLSFSWDAALTALSVAGSEALCDLYHDPDEVCVHADLGCAYEATLEIAAVYEFPFRDTATRAFNDAATVARVMQETSASLTSDHYPLPVDMQVQYTNRYQMLILRLSARQQWILDEQLHDDAELREALSEICAELGNMLHALASYEAAPSYPLSDEARAAEHKVAPGDETDPRFETRTYLRPPTA